MNRITARELMNYLKTRGRSYRAEPIFNSIAAAQDAAPLVVMGYALRGPRRNQKTVAVDADGTYPLDEVKLWCDGIDYATAKINERRA
jgi:hypothetical protein